MREAVYLRIHQPRWNQYQQLLKRPDQLSPDQLAEIYIRVNDDLSYVRTQFPKSTTTRYLNQLATEIYHLIYRNKKQKGNRLKTFWLEELPLLYYTHRSKILYAFLVFIIACTIGALSAANDDSFVRLILGDAYVEQTIENINRGDPMAIYKQPGRTNMSLAITFNNIRVSFLVFVAGILFSVGSFLVLFQNGVMLGSFQYFFYQQGLLATSAGSIWIHGTLEISAIVLAGAAGILMGHSLLFPGTYTRLQSLQKGARDGAKMVVGLIPIFVMAGFLEGFITRLTDIDWVFKLLIITLSASFIVFYFFIYPYKLHRDGIYQSKPEKEIWSKT